MSGRNEWKFVKCALFEVEAYFEFKTCPIEILWTEGAPSWHNTAHEHVCEKGNVVSFQEGTFNKC